jgi:hypothetical protein
MRYLARYAALAAVIALFASTAKAQLYTQHPTPLRASFCLDKEDAYEVAHAHLNRTAPEVWHQKVEEGKCAVSSIPNFFFLTIANLGEVRVVEMMVKPYDRWVPVYGVMERLPTRMWEA